MYNSNNTNLFIVPFIIANKNDKENHLMCLNDIQLKELYEFINIYSTSDLKYYESEIIRRVIEKRDKKLIDLGI